MSRVPFGVIAILFLCTCAQVKSPTGGEKDITPPQLIMAIPADQSLRFQEDRVVLHFDERIKLDGIHQKLLVSPPLNVKPSIAIQGGDRVVISGLGTLLPNTTYTFNFGDAIVDLTEGNAASALSYVIATGDVLDERSVSGTVINAFTEGKEKGVLVMLHVAADTGDVRTTRPRYFDRTNDQGQFHLKHLAAGSYHLVALRDNNGNYLYDLPNEEVAFINHPLELAKEDSVLHGISLRLFLAEASEQFLKEAKVLEEGALMIITSRYSSELRLKPIEEMGKAFHFLTENREGSDTSSWWPSDTTGLVGRSFQLMDAQQLIDTVQYRPLRKPKFGPELRVGNATKLDSVDLLIYSSKPIAAVDPDRIVLTADSLRIPFEATIAGGTHKQIGIKMLSRSDTPIEAIFYPKAVKDIYNGHNDTLLTTIGKEDEGQFGQILLRIDSLSDSVHVLQLLNGQQHVVQQEPFTGTTYQRNWGKLRSGAYSIRIIEDGNMNGRWDTGSFDPPVAPEAVLSYGEPINVRAGWKLELNWSATGAQ